MKNMILAAVLGLMAATAAAAPLNINTATEKELAGLEKIGPVRAKKIVDYRNQHGAFKTKADLKKFISDKEYEVIKEKVVASGATAKTAPAKAAAKPAQSLKTESKAASKAVEKAPKTLEKAATKATEKAAVTKTAPKTAAPAAVKTEAAKVVKPAASMSKAAEKAAH